MADHPITAYLFYNDAWNDVTTHVSQNAPVVVSQGTAEISDAPKPGSLAFTFEDPDGRYRVHSPASPLYGQAGRNTPAMLATQVAYEDFEDATFAITIGSGASVNPWARSATSPHTGSWCFKSGTTADGSFSDAIITVPTGANVCTLWYRTDCHADDRLRISTGGILRRTIGGTGGTWTPITVPVMENTSGVKEVYVRYLKDAATTAGADAVYIDDVTFWTAREGGEVVKWAPDRTLRVAAGIGSRTTEVEVNGLLNRIGKWTDPVQSCFTRSILQFSPRMLGFWPGEDDRNATAMSNLLSSGTAAVAAGVSFGDSDVPDGGGEGTIRLTSTSTLSGNFISGSSTAWQIGFAFKLNTLPVAGPDYPIFSFSTTAGATWTLAFDPAGYSVQVTDATGLLENLLVSGFGSTGTPDDWTYMRLQASISGSSVTWALSWYRQGTSNTSGVGNTFTATSLGRLSRWKVAGNPTMDNAHIGYVFAVTTLFDNILTGTTSSLIAAFNGYSGETATNRAIRLGTEYGVPIVIRGYGLPSQVMGPQQPDRVLDLFREIADTDGALLTDFEGMSALCLRLREDLYAQAVKLALTFGVDVAAPLTPVLDDLNTHNYVTVKNRTGGQAVAEDTTSIVGSAPPPAGVGRYEQTVNVNVAADGQLADLANWWLRLGTQTEPRYSTVTVDLDANPSLEDDIEALVPGDRITITGLDPDVVDLLYLGVRDSRANQKRRTAQLLCVPYRQYDIAVYDDTAKRYDSRTSTLNAGYSSSATSIVVTFTDINDQWSQTGEPYDWSVAGERIRVQSMGAVSGSGPYTQTATVQRSVNGVSKAQTAGAAVHMHPDQLARYAL